LEITVQDLPHNTVSVKFSIKPEDYQQEFKKQVNTLARQASMPGFRPGTVPPDLIKSKYGPSILHDILNKKVQEELQNVIKEKNYYLIAKPLLKEYDLKNLKSNEEFSFNFHLAIMPDFSIDYSVFSPILDYHVETTDESIEEQLKSLQKTEGKHREVQAIESLERTYKLSVEMIEVDASGTKVENGYNTQLSFYSDNPNIRPYLTESQKIGDTIPIQISNFFNSIHQASAVLQISRSKIEELYQKNFHFIIKQIWEVELLDKEKELFPLIFRKPAIPYHTGVKEFKKAHQEDLQKKIKEFKRKLIDNQIVNNFNFDINEEIVAHSLMSDYQLNKIEDVYHYFPNFLNRVKVDMVIQKILQDNPEVAISLKDVQKDIEQNIREILTPKKATSEIENPDIQELKPEETLNETDSIDKYVQSMTKEIMQNKEFVNKKFNELQNDRIIRFFEEKVGKNTQNISVKEFIDIYSAID